MAAEDWQKQRNEEKKLEIAVNQSQQHDMTLRHGIWATVCAIALVITVAIICYTVIAITKLNIGAK